MEYSIEILFFVPRTDKFHSPDNIIIILIKGGVILKTVVYADILIIINFLMNYLLLRANVVLNGSVFKTSRLIVSSIIGSLFSLIIYIENIPSFITPIAKMICMLLMILTAFKISSLKIFIRYYVTFSAVNIIFAGIMLALNVFLFPETALYNNGIVYFDINILSLAFFSIISYIVIYLIKIFTKSKIPDKCIYSIKIFYDNKFVEGDALYDTGNKLCDCFSGKPVIICDKKFIEKLITNKKIENMKNYRLIPYSTINGKGAIPAFKAESVEITVSGKCRTANDIFIGITENKIIPGGYSALFGTPFINTAEEII